MATIASNVSGAAGKWVPYYYKPFKLGRFNDGDGSTDGNTYITQTVGGTDGTVNNGICFSSHNCGYYYKVTYKNTSTDAFEVKKYDSNDTLVDTLEASAGYNWDMTGATSLVTIDIGVAIYFDSNTSAEVNDVYTITLPSIDTMKRRRIYHGGYSTFMKVPEVEGALYHSDIIPSDLKGKNITVSFNPDISIYGNLSLAHSEDGSSGNYSVTAALEWNINPQGGHSSTSVASYGWHADETWSLGSMTHIDIDPLGDLPVHTHLPASDLTGTGDTGTAQAFNILVAGRAGHAKFRLEYEPGTGTAVTLADNQFWPIILTIS